MSPHFETYPRADGDWGWRLVAANGEIVAAGEGYTREADARRAISTVVDLVSSAMSRPIVEAGS